MNLAKNIYRTSQALIPNLSLNTDPQQGLPLRGGVAALLARR